MASSSRRSFSLLAVLLVVLAGYFNAASCQQRFLLASESGASASGSGSGTGSGELSLTVGSGASSSVAADEETGLVTSDADAGSFSSVSSKKEEPKKSSKKKSSKKKKGKKSKKSKKKKPEPKPEPEPEDKGYFDLDVESETDSFAAVMTDNGEVATSSDAYAEGQGGALANSNSNAVIVEAEDVVLAVTEGDAEAVAGGKAKTYTEVDAEGEIYDHESTKDQDGALGYAAVGGETAGEAKGKYGAGSASVLATDLVVSVGAESDSDGELVDANAGAGLAGGSAADGSYYSETGLEGAGYTMTLSDADATEVGMLGYSDVGADATSVSEADIYAEGYGKDESVATGELGTASGTNAAAIGGNIDGAVTVGVTEAGGYTTSEAGAVGVGSSFSDAASSIYGETDTYVDSFTEGPGVSEVELGSDSKISGGASAVGKGPSSAIVGGNSGSIAVGESGLGQAAGESVAMGAIEADAAGDYSSTDTLVEGDGYGNSYALGDGAGSVVDVLSESESANVAEGEGGSTSLSSAGATTVLGSVGGLGVTASTGTTGGGALSTGDGDSTSSDTSVLGTVDTLAAGSAFDSDGNLMAVGATVTLGSVVATGGTEAGGEGPSVSSSQQGSNAESTVVVGADGATAVIGSMSDAGGNVATTGAGEDSVSGGSVTSGTMSDSLGGTGVGVIFSPEKKKMKAKITGFATGVGSGSGAGSASLAGDSENLGTFTGTSVDINGGSKAESGVFGLNAISRDAKEGGVIDVIDAGGSGMAGGVVVSQGLLSETATSLSGRGAGATGSGVIVGGTSKKYDDSSAIAVGEGAGAGAGSANSATAGIGASLSQGSASGSGNSLTETNAGTTIGEDAEAGVLTVSMGNGAANIDTFGEFTAASVAVDSAGDVEGSAGAQIGDDAVAGAYYGEESVKAAVSGEGENTMLGINSGAVVGGEFAAVAAENSAEFGVVGGENVASLVGEADVFEVDFETDADAGSVLLSEDGKAGSVRLKDGKLTGGFSFADGLAFGTSTANTYASEDGRFDSVVSDSETTALALTAGISGSGYLAKNKVSGGVAAGRSVGFSATEAESETNKFGTDGDVKAIAQTGSDTGSINVGYGVSFAKGDADAGGNGGTTVNEDGAASVADSGAGTYTDVGSGAGPYESAVGTVAYGVGTTAGVTGGPLGTVVASGTESDSLVMVIGD